MINAAGWRVELVADQRLRVTWRGYWQATCSNTAEVAEHVDLATLVPEGWAHVRPLMARGPDARAASKSL
jgi:hypothetical protein